MRKFVFYFLSLMIAAIVSSFFFQSPLPGAQSQQQNSIPSDTLKKFLQDYVGGPSSAERNATLYFAAFVDLKDDGTREAIVYLMNDGWCGSGGCTTLVLAPTNSSYKIVSKITITRPPIRVLVTKSNGWHDIAVQVQGGELRTPSRLSFHLMGRPIHAIRPHLRPNN